MGLEEQCVIAAIIRDGKMALPKGESTFQAGDEIIAVASPEGAKRLAELLAHPVYPVRKPRKKADAVRLKPSHRVMAESARTGTILWAATGAWRQIDRIRAFTV